MVASVGKMNIAKAASVAALLFAMIAAARAPAAAADAIFVSNPYSVTAYPAGASGDVAPLSLATGMAAPTGIARDARGRIYVSNSATSTITVYPPGANGNVSPLAVIGGANSRLAFPADIALDSSAKIYVLTGESINIYPPLGSSIGILDEAPIVTITGDKTGLYAPHSIAVDSNGSIFVSNLYGKCPKHTCHQTVPGNILVFAAGSNGNVAPIAAINGPATKLFSPAGIAVDSSGNLYVANSGITSVHLTIPDSVNVYPAGSNGDVPPITIITGDISQIGYIMGGIAVDSNGNIYVTTDVAKIGPAVNVYQPGSNGNVAPIAIITGSDSGLAQTVGLALDSSGSIYAMNQTYGNPEGDGVITVYPAGSNGDAIPVAAVTSNFTGISSASGIAVDSGGTIYVANALFPENPCGEYDGTSSINVYSPGSYANEASVGRIAGENTILSFPSNVAVDSGGKIYVLNRRGGSACYGSVTVYPAGSEGDIAPSATLDVDTDGRDFPVAMAVDPSGNLYTANNGLATCRFHGHHIACYKSVLDSIKVYPAGSNGTVTPKAIITGLDTGLYPNGIAVDSIGNIYVSNGGFGPKSRSKPSKTTGGQPSVAVFYQPGSVTIYSPSSTGNVPPVAKISGPHTGLGYPSAIGDFVAKDSQPVYARILGNPGMRSQSQPILACLYAKTRVRRESRLCTPLFQPVFSGN